MKVFFTFLSALALLTSCSPKVGQQLMHDDGKITIALLQINDVYEIAGVSGGKLGNLSRVEGYYDKIQEAYPNSMMMLAGDFLNPSLINSMKYEGERIKGRQMVEVLNAMDLDLVAFGNHEFDLDEDELQARMDESDFDWISTNLQQKCGDRNYPFYRTKNGKKIFAPETVSRTFIDEDGTTVKLGIFSATLNSNPKPFVAHFDEDSCAHEAIKYLKEDHEIIVGLTHLDIADDIALAKSEPDVDLILGGHDHDHMIHTIGQTVITKADANAKTVYLHILEYDTNTRQLDIASKLVEMNTSISKNPMVQEVIVKWSRILDENIQSILPDPYRIVYTTTEPLDGRESTIRHKQTKLGSFIAKSMKRVSANQATAAILNSGSIRIDDQLSGNLSGVDIFRILPFGGSIVDVELTGKLLKEILEYSEDHKSKGAYLQLDGITLTGSQWLINNSPLVDQKNYNIVLNDFLLMGYDIPFLTEENPGIIRIDKPQNQNDPRKDVRLALINYLESLR